MTRLDLATDAARKIFDGSDRHTSYEYMVPIIMAAMEKDSAELQAKLEHETFHARELGNLLAATEERLGVNA